MVTLSNLIYGGGSYARGAETITKGKPLTDGNIDRIYSDFPQKIRKQIKFLNVNGTDIPTQVESATKKTIGVSVNTQVESDNPKFNNEAETFIERHNIIGVGELTGVHHFNSSLRTISDFDKKEGGIIIRHHYNTAWKIPYKYELVGVDMINISKTKRTTEKNPSETTMNGIVRNKWGQKTHIWLYDTEDKRDSTKVPYKNITYYSDVWVSIGQQTAISKLVSMLSTLDRSEQYSVAELEAAIEDAKAGHFIKSTAYDEIMKIATDIYNNKKNSSASFDEQIVNFKQILTDMSKIGINKYGTTPIPASDEVQFNTKKSTGIYKQLNDNSEMKMASSQGMSDIGIYNKASEANYSAIKYVSETDQLSADIRWDNISNKIVKEIHTRLIEVGIQIGAISNRVAYWKDPYRFNKFRYLRQMKIDIEPKKTADANKSKVELGTTTEGIIVEETYGVKYETFLRKKFEQEIMKIKIKEEVYKKANIDMPKEDDE